jgi:hypothetical protein
VAGAAIWIQGSLASLANNTFTHRLPLNGPVTLTPSTAGSSTPEGLKGGVNLYSYADERPTQFSDSTGLSTDTYHADRHAHGGPHIDRRNKAGQTVGRYRPDGTPIPHKGCTPPPIPKSDRAKFTQALRELRRIPAFAPIPAATTYDAYCKQNPEDCAAMFGLDPCRDCKR